MSELTLPGPRLPRAVQGVRFLASEHRMLQRYHRRYGDVFALKVWPFDPLVVVSDPKDIKRIFTGDPAQLHAGEGNAVLGPIVGPHSVLVLDERPHLRTRKLLLPPFHGERMRVYGAVMRELTEAEVATWPAGEPFPLLPAMQRLTLRIILRTVFGVEGARMAELERGLGRLMHAGMRVMLLPLLQRDWGPGSPQRRFEAARAEVDAMLLAEIRRRRASGERGDDVLSMLLDARGEDGEEPTEAELRDHLITLLVAGHETTATQLSWTFERLVRHPEAHARARASAHWPQRQLTPDSDPTTFGLEDVSWSIRWPTFGDRAARATRRTISVGTRRRLPATHSITSTPTTAAAQARRV